MGSCSAGAACRGFSWLNAVEGSLAAVPGTRALRAPVCCPLHCAAFPGLSTACAGQHVSRCCWELQPSSSPVLVRRARCECRPSLRLSESAKHQNTYKTGHRTYCRALCFAAGLLLAAVHGTSQAFSHGDHQGLHEKIPSLS